MNEAPSSDKTTAVAARIADALLRNAFGDVAQRLVLELPDGRNAGGRCRTAIASEVERVLQEQVDD
jgi:hypothetical protein